MKKVIRLTEGDLHHIVKESVRKILKEYEWNGRTPEQDAAAIKAANTPTSWKQHMLRSQIASTVDDKQHYNHSMDAFHKAQKAFADKYLGGYGKGYDMYEELPGYYSNYVRGTYSTNVYPTSGRLAYNQSYIPADAQRYTEKNYGYSKGYNVPKEMENTPESGVERNGKRYWGKTGDITMDNNGRNREEPSHTRYERNLPSSPEFKKLVNDIDNDMTDFYSGNYAERLLNKKQQLGNKGKY